LNEAMTRDCEALLMFAARREHLDRVIRPALERGDWVVCDRFTDATYAYQGGGHGMPKERIRVLEEWTHADCQPDLTLLFDVPVTVSRSRLDSAKLAGRELDKFEREAMPFFTRVREAYLERAKELPRRIRVIDSTRPMDVVRAEVMAHLETLGLGA
jgi:dTMP kinase